MKKIITGIFALLAVPVAAFSFSACADRNVGTNSGYTLQDTEVYPVVAAPYEQESRAALKRWQDAGVLASEELTAQVAAELFAYACYNEEYVDKYVYFSDQSGETNISSGSSTVRKQDYKLIIHGDQSNPGYKYHYTIKNVDEIDGPISMFESLFENGTRLRFVENGILYGFNGKNQRYVEDDTLIDPVLTCDWSVDSSRWGTEDSLMLRREGEKLDLDGIKEDIVRLAQATADGDDEPVIHCNINILADGIVENATITPTVYGNNTVYSITMNIDTAVANADTASMQMLRSANGSSDCTWVSEEDGGGFRIIFQIWDNGLFKLYGLNETWSGKTYGFSGTAHSNLSVRYSYSNRDTDLTEKQKMLDEVLAENPV